MRRQGIHRALARRLAIAAAACLAVSAVAPATGSADEAEAVYDPSTVSVIDLQLPQPAIEALEADPEGAYQKGTFSFAQSDGSPDSVGSFSAPQEVEVRLKGSASFRPLSGKAAFKFKFPKAGPFLGLRKMTLNNMVEDPSMTHETLAFALHRALGVPASRTGFVYLTINGEDFGVYMNVENYDNVAMAKKLGGFDGDVQHVYEGENGTDVEPGLVGNFEIDEGPDNISDLEALAAAVTDPDPDPWSTAVGAHAELEEMTRMWAAEKYSGQFDGYAGGPALDHPNNYFLATGPDGLFRMLPWGQDETWKEENHLPFDGEAGVMFEGCLADPGCEALYEGALESVQMAVPTLKLDQLAACTAELLAPWQQLEEDESSRFEYDAGQIAAAVAETRAFIASRPDELADYLGNTGPEQPAPVDSCPPDEPEEPTEPKPPVVNPPPVPPLVAPASLLSFGPSKLKGNMVTTTVEVPAAGAVTQKVSARIDGKLVRACSNRANPPGAGTVWIGCRLWSRVRDARAERQVQLRIRIGFAPQGGKPRSVVRTLTASKRG